MIKHCCACNNTVETTEEQNELLTCPKCGGTLQCVLSEEDIQKQNDDFTVINTLLL